MKRKGFTLIELLAVIIVLAIIALIATPTILGVIEKARKGAFKSSALGIMDAGELYVATHTVSYNDVGTVTFTCNGESCLDVEGNKLSFKGEVPTSGTVIVNKKGLATVRELTNGKYCITGERTNLIITKDCKEQVLTPPIVTVTGEEVENSGYYLNQKASIVFNSTNTNSPEYFIKTTKTGVSNIGVTEECGNKTNPSSCNIVEETTTLEANKWYKVSRNIEVTYNELSKDAGTIVAIMKNGDIYINSNVESVGAITIETNYTVNHYQMNTDEETYKLVDSQTLTGYAYTNVTPIVKTYEGFTSPEVQTISILPDGTSIVDYYYSRNKYIIKYEANGGEGTMEDTICIYGVDCTIRANAYTLSGYEFNGWTGSDGGNYTDGQSVTDLTSSNNSVIIMTANWESACSYSAGTTWSYNYTGGMQSFTVPCTGNYKLEVYGAAGSPSGGGGSGGYGGYSSGYITLSKNAVVYVCVGGVGGYGASGGSGGYNGGGSAYAAWGNYAGAGGGATHIGTRNGTLKEYGNTNGLYIVAGGGGGSFKDDNRTTNGGSGGGLSGGSTSTTWLASGKSAVNLAGATQNSGNAFGQGQNAPGYSGGGGGGLYGGISGGGCPGSGGSGYIGGVTNGSTANGQRSGNGYAVITLSSY